MKYFLIIFMLFFSSVYAEESSVVLEKAPVNIHDKESIKRGAKFFATTCMVCHTMVYLRYNKLAKDAGVLYDKMPINVTQWPLNVRPPDLSLEASVRGADWIYTYLHSFYSDPSRPTGVNNLVNPNTAMAGILVPFQGQQVLLAKENAHPEKFFDHRYQWYDLLELQTQGSMTSQQFDAMTADIVNFLVYASEPYRADQERLGIWVICFLIVLFVLVYMLKREYWKDVK